MTLQLTRLVKRFGDNIAVNELDLTVPEGSLFGFLGSNGAGKTTTIRMILGLMLPDGGEMSWKGRRIDDQVRTRMGYLAEERGLYAKMKVLDQLVYFGRLRGMSRAEATRRVDEWLERLGITEHRTKRADQLSKGNQQKVQFIAAVLHEPELVILDEPFSGLDPVNRQVLQEAMFRLHKQGATVMFSSHQMDMVENLCQEVALIHRSRLVLGGNLREIKRTSGKRVVYLAVDGSYDFLDRFPVQVTRHADMAEVRWTGALDPQEILRAAVAAGPVRRFVIGEPSLTELYVEKVGGSHA